MDLAEDEVIMDLAEDEVIQVRINARGGQGGVTAGQLLVQAWGGPAKCFPKFGAERQGSPTEVFALMSKGKDLSICVGAIRKTTLSWVRLHC